MSKDNAFTFMTMDILEHILDRADDPSALSEFLTSQMRELLGARMVILLETADPGAETNWRLTAVCPGRLAAELDRSLLFALADACAGDRHRHVRTGEASDAAGEILRAGGWSDAAVLPLGFGTVRHGMLMLLDLLDGSHIESVLDTLAPMGRIIGLVLKNSRTYRSLEDTIEQRTSQLAASELLFRSLTETAPVGVFQTDPAGTCTYLNATWSELVGLPPLEAIGLPWLDTIHPEDRERIEGLWRDCRAAGLALNTEARYLHRDGRELWALLQVSPAFGLDGRVGGFVGTVTDITDRIRHEAALRSLNDDLERRVEERTEELLQANQELKAALERSQMLQEAIIVKEKLASLTPMVAGVSHELNTPIGNIAVLASAMQERLHELLRRLGPETGAAEIRAFLSYIDKTNEMVMKSASFAGTLVQSFKKVVVDREGAQRRAFRLAELVDDCLNLIRPSYKRHPWRMENTVPPDIELDSYPGALGQVIDNLVRNAFIHGFEGRPNGTVTISAESFVTGPGHPKAWVRIRVSDDGKGIPFNQRHKIFDPFFTTHLGSGGSGLGLSITYNLIQQVLGGTISVTSQSAVDGVRPEECGSTFTIEIPLERKD